MQSGDSSDSGLSVSEDRSEALPVQTEPSGQAEDFSQVSEQALADPLVQVPKKKLDLASLALVLGLYSAVRVGLLLTDVLVAHLSYDGALSGPLTAWDASHYVSLAVHGYPTVLTKTKGLYNYSTAAFSPLFPYLIKLFTKIGLTALQSGLLVSIVSGAAATLIVWRIASDLFGDKVGLISAILFSVFPGMAIAWGMLYSDCIGSALAAASLYLMLKRRWAWAGLIGFLATATSPLALPLVLSPLMPAYRELKNKRLPMALVASIITPMGFLLFVIALGVRYHNAFVWFDLQNQAWGATVDFGSGLLKQLPHLWAEGYTGRSWMEWAGIIAVLGALFCIFKSKMPWELTVYTLGSFFLLFVSNQLGFKPRLLVWAFPALIAVAYCTRRRGWQVVAISFAMLLPIVFVLYSALGDTATQP